MRKIRYRKIQKKFQLKAFVFIINRIKYSIICFLRLSNEWYSLSYLLGNNGISYFR